MDRRRRLLAAFVVAACAGSSLGNAAWSAWDQGWTYDEAHHLLWSERLLDSGVTERTSQHRLNSKTPISLPNVLFRRAAERAGIADERALRFAARLPNVLWLALLLLGVRLAAGRAISPAAGRVAVVLCALEPNLTAHGSVATSDLPFAAATFGTLALAAAWATRPSLARAALLGACLGLALLAKVTAVLLLPALCAVPVLAAAHLRARGRRLLADAAACAGAVWLVVAGGYLFHEMGHTPAGLAPRSAPFAALARVAPAVPLPVPASFLTAFDASLATGAREEWNVVLLGQRHPDGVWYYFLLLALLKTPLPLLLAVPLGLVRSARDPSLRAHPLVLLSGVAAAWLLLYFSLLFRVQVGYRYVLMVLPLLAVVAGAGLSTLPWTRWRFAAVGALLWALAENAFYWGNPLSFTHAAVQPKHLVYRLIADSNVDWGQNRERIQGWLRERRLTYTHLDPAHVLPGHNTVSLNAVAGVGDPEPYAWVRKHLRPVAHLGHTYLLFEVGEGTFDEYLEAARRLVPGSLAKGLCPPGLAYVHEPIGATVPFVLDENPPPDQRWVVCVVAPQGMELAFQSRVGTPEVGHFTSPTTCETKPAVQGQELWWRLDPGTHALCMVTPPNRRSWLPYRVEGRWYLGGRKVLIDVRRLDPLPTPPPPEGTSPRSSSPPRPPGG